MQNKSEKIYSAMLALVMGAGALLPAGTLHAETTAASLTRIEAETLLLRAREKQLDVQSAIISKQNEIAAKQTVGAMITQTAVVGDPVVRAVEGVGENMFATLEMADGSMVEVQNGSTLSGGMRVLSIKSNEVMVQTASRKRIRLSGYTQKVNTFNPATPSPGLAMPAPAARGGAR
ncbi:type IV pilus biogenesis protein PilP [Massilia sp. MB5]|uniref:type IV pilus biogenesis protein PilP n=1 Tax=unclassified Massilia TaxID=2609279 RepID=UPI00067D9733|nr:MULTISPECIES: type IV pilus biogenesis protein PilP [unclassified Massilia]AKU22896.1 pilus assembly protein PilP [Massilia sp. NR 4-1]UMR32274.1 type IV pilus biogenesis protein PilP [Massilia sp. MB5]